MDDGGIRPAVNQTTKFLVSARAACWEVLSMDEAVLHLLSRPLSLSHPLTRSHDAQGCNYASVGPSQSREGPSKTLSACPLDPARSREDVFVLDEGLPYDSTLLPLGP